MLKNIVIVALAVATIIILAIVLLYLVGQQEDRPMPLEVSYTGTILKIEGKTIFLERYLANGIDKETIEVEVNRKTEIEKTTIKIDPEIDRMMREIKEPTKEEMDMMEQAVETTKETISVTDLKIGYGLDVVGKKDIFNNQKITAITIKTVVQEPGSTELEPEELESEEYDDNFDKMMQLEMEE